MNLKCLRVGHTWEFRWARIPGDGCRWLNGSDAFYERFGVSVLHMVCLRCGKTKQRKFLGANGEAVSDQSELEQLRKMTGFK